ncbi:MAG: sensor histidine kinase KdpD [Thermincola sp.]|jgi:two-component system sensor histidine kinase KdpD|nr:sensor histidine kinase KdpD [Thermincola sp.]MDT3702041.1 sensor histidine kinase KdpD [Thermincola sp.]
MGTEKRLEPERILANQTKESRGKLTVFLGAAAGVGKTYAMLEAGKERLAEGVDVIVGLVVPQGRTETETILEGIPALPSILREYKGKHFAEMDLDALLERRPGLALVDELAHTNIPGSRHAKRYLDVEELLAAGINVYTTFNIQHLESLNDLVAQITGIRVRETVPDRILENAQIQLVDIPPEELIQRFKEGKVNVPGQAAEAMRKFLRPGNINALRELALRFTALRIDHQLESYMRVHHIDGPWPTGERVMVCVSPSPFSAQLVRIGRRTADSNRAEWLAVYVETPRRFPASETAKDQLAKNLILAEKLGAETVTLYGDDVAQEILEMARKRNISQIIIGRPLHLKVRELLQGSVVDKIIRQGQGISVHVIPGKSEVFREKVSRQPRNAQQSNVPTDKRRPILFPPYVLGFLGMVLLALIISPIKSYLGPVNIAMLHLLMVSLIASRWGTYPGCLAALMGVVFFDLFFVEPAFSFTVADIRYLISFAILLIVALITGSLSTKVKKQVHRLRQGEARVSALYSLSRDIAAVADLSSVLDSIVRKVAETVESQVVFLLPGNDGRLEVRATSDPEADNYFDKSELEAATWSFENGQRAGLGSDTLGTAAALYIPLRTERATHGILGIRSKNLKGNFDSEQIRLLEAFSGLAAMALNRVKLSEQATKAVTLAESERLRTALFNSLSHDLRTPLASIIGAVTGLLEGECVYSPAARVDLLQTIHQGAIRMNRFVNNLLDMARLESGMLQLKKEWCDIQDVIGVAVSRMGETLTNRPLKIHVEPDLPLIQADFVLIEQVLINLLDNALKYSKRGSEIAVSACQSGKHLTISVADRGHQIPEEDLAKIFDKFYRLSSRLQVSGTGLGLSICKGLVEAHGGKIWAENNPSGGVIMTFNLPVSDQQPGMGKEVM